MITMGRRRDVCTTEIIDGVPVRVLASGPLTDTDRAALTELIRVCRAKAEAEGPRHQADVARCGCGKRHCVLCGEVWPCTPVAEARMAAAEESPR